MVFSGLYFKNYLYMFITDQTIFANTIVAEIADDKAILLTFCSRKYSYDFRKYSIPSS